MKLTSAELTYVRAKDLFITDKCDGCGKLLNQSYRYTITRKPEVYCSALCRAEVFFAGRREGKKHATHGKCAYWPPSAWGNLSFSTDKGASFKTTS